MAYDIVLCIKALRWRKDRGNQGEEKTRATQTKQDRWEENWKILLGVGSVQTRQAEDGFKKKKVLKKVTGRLMKIQIQW